MDGVDLACRLQKSVGILILFFTKTLTTMVICFTINGHKHCIHIPILIDRWWWLKPVPGPDPGPLLNSDWIKSEVITPRQAQDLSILATMRELSTKLSPQMQRSFEEPMKQALGSVKLPEGASISMG